MSANDSNLAPLPEDTSEFDLAHERSTVPVKPRNEPTEPKAFQDGIEQTGPAMPAGPVLLDERYRLDGILGTGGMGVVYKAFDIRLERVVALKTIKFREQQPDEKFQENLVKRFMREGKMVARLNHPNVVTVYDAGAADGTLYLVMEFVQGKTLADVLNEKGSLSLEEAADTIAQVCDGLASAHDLGIIHRDIKPANIMVLNNGLVKVMDFGLARGEQLNQMTQLTAGHVIGTPEYMSPEQIKSEPVDARSDLFSVGIVLYMLLTGEKPFRGHKLMEMMSSILFGTPTPPSTKNDKLDPKIDTVVAKFLAKDREHRYSSSREAAEALRGLLQLAPIELPELLDGMVFRRSLVELLPLPLARLYSRTFNTKEPRDRLSNTLFLTEAYTKLISCICINYYLQHLPRTEEIDASLQGLALPMAKDWLGWIEQIGNHCGRFPDRRGLYPHRIFKALNESCPEKESIRLGGQMLSVFLQRPLEQISIWSVLSLAVELRDLGVAKDNFPLEQIDALGVSLFNTLGEAFNLADPLMRGQLIFLDKSATLPDDTVETPRLSLQGAMPLRISPLRQMNVQPLREETISYFPMGETIGLALNPFVTYLEHELGADLYFMHYDLRSGEVNYLSYNTGHRYLSMALAEAQLQLLNQIFEPRLNANELKQLRDSIRATHADKLPLALPETPKGRIMGDFELLEKIGEGGMGTVYKARQLSLNRIVALKVLVRGRADNELMVARFKREVATLASCDHPNVVKILDSGFEKGEYYYAMEFIDGVTLSELYAKLKQRSNNRPLDDKVWEQLRAELFVAQEQGQKKPAPLEGRGYYETLAFVGREVSNTLHHIHEMGILHRDVKPSNIMITRTSRIVLMDFGLAKGQADATMTTADHAIGTIRYASPEQLQSKKMNVDHRTDVYSLGATLYELTSLQPIFPVETDVELITKLIYEEPIPLRKLNGAIPPDLEIIITKAMMKRPEQRYSDAAELAMDLGNFLEHRHIKARPPSLSAVFSGAMRRHKEASLTAFLAVVVLVLGTVWGFFNIAAEKNVAQQALEQANRNLMLAYMKEGDFHLDKNVPLEAAFSYYQSLRLQDTPATRAGLMRSLQQSPALAASFVGHTASIQALAVSSDGNTLVSGDDHGEIKVWSTGRQKQVASLSAHSKAITALALSPDAKLLISASKDRSVKFWDLEKQQVSSSLDVPRGVRALALSRDGNLLALGTEEGSILLKNAADQSDVATLEGHTAVINSIAFSQDGALLASAAADNLIKIWDMSTRHEAGTLELSSKPLAIALNRNSQRLASSNSDGTVRIWDVAEHRELTLLHGAQSEAGCVAFSPAEDVLAYCGQDNATLFWDNDRQENLVSIHGHTHPIRALAFLPEGRELLSASDDWSIKEWNLKAHRYATALEGQTGLVHTLALSPDGQNLASGGSDARVNLWKPASGLAPTRSVEQSDEVFSLDFSQDSRLLAAGSGDGSILLMNMLDPDKNDKLSGHEDIVYAVRFSPDGKLLASGSEDGRIKLWDLASRSELATLTGHGGGINSLVFTPDGKLLVSGSDDQTIRIWDVATKKEIDALTGHTGKVYALAMSPDGKLLASGGGDLLIKIWNFEERRELATLSGHDDLVWALAFRPDGKTLASGSNDGTLRLWDVEKRQEKAILGTALGKVNTVLFSPDGKKLYSTGRDRQILIWDLTFFSRPLGPIIAENKADYLLPYRDSRFHPRFFPSIASAAEEILRTQSNLIPSELIEELVWKYRDTGLTPGDFIALLHLLDPDRQLSVVYNVQPSDLYSQADWKQEPTRGFLRAAADYFLSKRLLRLADLCYGKYFQRAPDPQAAADEKATVAMRYIETGLVSTLPIELAKEAIAARPEEDTYKLIHALALILKGDLLSPTPILEPLNGKFTGAWGQAFDYALGVCSLRGGKADEGKARLEKLAAMSPSLWSRRAAEALRPPARKSELVPTATP